MLNISYLQDGATVAYVPYTLNTYPDSQECAYFANLQLRDQGYKASGNAWSRNGAIVYNGYTDSGYEGNDANAHGKAAMQALYKNFDTTSLDPTKVYTVNMYYPGSSHLQEAYNDDDGNGLRGTHTGNLYYDTKSKRWKVNHSIHGKVRNEDWVYMQQRANTRGGYGPTAIQETETPGFLDKVVGGIRSLFKEEGSVMNYLNY